MKMKKAIALIELIFAIVVIAITLLSVPNLISKTNKASKEAITQEAVSNAASELDMIMSSFWDEECVEPKRNNPILEVGSTIEDLKEMNVTLTSSSGSSSSGGGSGGLLGSMPGLNGGSGASTTTVTRNIGGRRKGSPKNTTRRFYTKLDGTRYQATPPSMLKLESNEEEPDDIDDFNGKTTYLVDTSENTTVQEGDYKDKKIKLNISVNYIKDAPTSSTPSTFNKKVISFDNPFSNVENLASTNIKEIVLTLRSDNDKNKKVVLKAFSCNIGAGILKEKTF